MILLNPGPVNLSDRVRQALLQPDLCHREIEFTQLQQTIRNKLLQVYDLSPDCYGAILLTGSGTAAMEAMVTSLVPKAGKLLVIENGVYGERLSKIANIHGIDLVKIQHPWGNPIDLKRLEICLDNHEITHLAVVHHETTTGRLNNLAQLSLLCQERNIQLLVDGVSSFGAEEIRFDDWGIAACAATANKCLHGVPGTSFVIVRRDALDVADTLAHTLYLDLRTYCQQQDLGKTPFTQSIQTFYALAEALQELEDGGGWRSRNTHYRKLASLVREGLVTMGIQPLLPRDSSSVVLNAYYLPDGISYDTFHDHLKNNGYIIYSGQGELAQSIFRVSTMGAINRDQIEHFLIVVNTLLRSN